MQVLECRPESVKSIQSAQTAVPVHRLQNSSRHCHLQTPTGTKTRLLIIAITVGHRIGPESIQNYARLRTILVVGVAREYTVNHCAEVLGDPYT